MGAQESREPLQPWRLLRGARVLPTCVGVTCGEATLGGTLRGSCVPVVAVHVCFDQPTPKIARMHARLCKRAKGCATQCATKIRTLTITNN